MSQGTKACTVVQPHSHVAAWQELASAIRGTEGIVLFCLN